MSRRGLQGDDAHAAAHEALKGGAIGLVKWGLASVLLGVVGNAISPVYRNLTIQFKIYLQMSATALGASIDAERRMASFKRLKRIEYERARNQALWEEVSDEPYEPSASSK